VVQETLKWCVEKKLVEDRRNTARTRPTIDSNVATLALAVTTWSGIEEQQLVTSSRAPDGCCGFHRPSFLSLLDNTFNPDLNLNLLNLLYIRRTSPLHYERQLSTFWSERVKHD
jgi:hypothetical protein